MKTTRWILGTALFGSLFVLQGCGAGAEYQIPNVAPVVKPKPDDDLLDAIEGDDKASDAPSDKTGGADKPADAKPTDAPKADAPKAAPKK